MSCLDGMQMQTAWANGERRMLAARIRRWVKRGRPTRRSGSPAENPAGRTGQTDHGGEREVHGRSYCNRVRITYYIVCKSSGELKP